MIGLGSNRLTVCRRGGMSVTQAGRGGMEWLAGGRMPRWSGPYSVAATAALKAAFTAAQWATIRDYGFAHPEIVGYMNAYAPEDAKIAYSLVPTLGQIRSVNNGGSGYATTDILPLGNVELDIKVRVNSQTTTWIGICGRGRSHNTTDAIGLGHNRTSGKFSSYVASKYHDTALTGEYNKFYDVKISKSIISSTDIANGTVTSWQPNAGDVQSSTYYLYIFRWDSGNADLRNVGNCDIAEIIYKVDGDISAWFIPFKRNGQMELLDLVSGNLATRVGTFTELIDSPS